MPAYLRIHRFEYYSTRSIAVPSNGMRISPIQQGQYMREMNDPKLHVRIDGTKVGVNDYKKPGQFINGQDIGVPQPDPHPMFGRNLMLNDPQGPKVAQCWYEVQPGSHQLELAAMNGWWVMRVYGRINFYVEPGGVYTVSCQWQNNPNFHLILIPGEDVFMDPSGVITNKFTSSQTL
jgi:hypothetical protein